MMVCGISRRSCTSMAQIIDARMRAVIRSTPGSSEYRSKARIVAATAGTSVNARCSRTGIVGRAGAATRACGLTVPSPGTCMKTPRSRCEVRFVPAHSCWRGMRNRQIPGGAGHRRFFTRQRNPIGRSFRCLLERALSRTGPGGATVRHEHRAGSRVTGFDAPASKNRLLAKAAGFTTCPHRPGDQVQAKDQRFRLSG